MRVFLRVSIVALLALAALTYSAADIIDPWHPWSTFGITADSAGDLTTVDAYAQERGLNAGDVLDVARMSVADRGTVLGSNVAAKSGRTIDLPLRSGKHVKLVAHPHTRSAADNVTDIAATISLVAYILIAAALALLRPMPATWAFLIFSSAFFYNGDQAQQYFPAWLEVLYNFVLIPVLQAVGPMAFFSFALRFPNAQPAGASRVMERIFLFAAPLLATANVSTGSGLLGMPFPPVLNGAMQLVIVALYLPGIAMLISRYAHSEQDERTRLRWAVAAFSIAFLPYIGFTAAENSFASVLSLPATNLTQAWLLIAPAALAYTVLKHRLFDIRFVVSRALIFGFMTTLTVGVLALADWAFGKWLEQSRFQLIAEVALALALGFSMTSLHKRMERFLNNVIFHAQALALSSVRRFTHELDLIADPSQLLAQTLETLRTRLESEYIAIFTADGATFVQPEPAVHALPPLFSANDLAVLRLRRWTEPFECDVPLHPLRGALLLPMTVRTQLIGFIACGPKADHTHYVPEEIETLQSLAHRAGAGYAWLTLRPTLGSPLPLSS